MNGLRKPTNLMRTRRAVFLCPDYSMQPSEIPSESARVKMSGARFPGRGDEGGLVPRYFRAKARGRIVRNGRGNRKKILRGRKTKRTAAAFLLSEAFTAAIRCISRYKVLCPRCGASSAFISGKAAFPLSLRLYYFSLSFFFDLLLMPRKTSAAETRLPAVPKAAALTIFDFFSALARRSARLCSKSQSMTSRSV